MHQSASIEATQLHSLNSSPRKKKNPFRLPPTAELFGYREVEYAEQQAYKDRIRKMSLVERANELRPTVPPLITRGTTAHKTERSRSTFEIEEQRPLTRVRGHGQRIPEFIQQKREIYLVQMLIDRKNKEIKKINSMIDSQEAQLIQEDLDISKDATEYKLRTGQIETRLVQARKDAEAATRIRVEKSKELKMAQTNYGMLNSDILKNEDQLEIYQLYSNFLKGIAPEGVSYMEHFQDEHTLLDTFDNIEKENLFLIEQYQRLETKLSEGQEGVLGELGIIDSDIKVVCEKLSEVQPVPEIPIKEAELQKDSAILDSEMQEMRDLVAKSYRVCFGEDTNVSTLVMLEQIENALEKMYQTIKFVDPGFVDSKQAVKDKERREEARKEKAQKQEHDQKIKMELALARATRPIKKKTGRPIYKRTMPLKHEKKDDAQARRLRQELQRQEQLLYGDLDTI